MSSLPDEYATVERAVPLRDMVLSLALDRFPMRYGPATPLDLARLNGLLAATGQPLASQAEIDVFYGRGLPAGAVN